MSRIGKQIITIPSGVTVTTTGHEVTVKGPKGELKFTHAPCIALKIDGNDLEVKFTSKDMTLHPFHGLSRALINNMVVGVSNGFEKRLQIIGVGYRAQIAGKKLTLNLGFSHPVVLDIPAGITAEMDAEQKNTLVISGIDKQLVGQFSANIRSFRPPEPYKGKGIRYHDEHVKRKAGKSASK